MHPPGQLRAAALSCAVGLSLASVGAAQAQSPAAAPVPTPPASAPAPAPVPALDDDELSTLSLEALLATPLSVSSPRGDVVFDAPSTVSVIDRATIEEYGFASVSEAISTLAGINVMRTYLKRGLPTARGILQDHYANKVLVLIDGVPSWMAVTGEGHLDRVPIEQLERIEVLKGPASVVYGTNAYSGAINLVLAKGTGGGVHRGRVQAAVGTTKRFEGGGSYAYDDGAASVYVGAFGSTDDGFERPFVGEDDVAGQIHDYISGANFTLRAAHRSRMGEHSALFNAYSTRESYLGVVPALARGAGNDHKLDGYLVNYRFAVDITRKVDFQLGLTLDYNHRDLSRLGDDSERSDVTGYRVMGLARVGLDLARWLVVDFSFDTDYRVSESYSNYDTVTGETLADNNMANRDVWELSAVLMARLMLEPLVAEVPLTLQAGLRFTKNELFDDNVAFRGTLVYRLTDTQSLKLVAGQSFRAPTLFELYFATDSGTVFGSTTLEPERSLSVELAYLLGYEHFFAQVLGYYANYDNKIFRVRRAPSDPNDTSLIYVNGDPFSAFGLEAELMLRDADLFDAFVNYAFVSGDDGDDAGQGHYNFKYVPQHTLSAGLGKRYKGFFCSTVVNWVGDRGSPDGTLAGQVTWDLTAGYRGELGTHTVTAKNLLDEDVRVPAFVRRNLDSYSSGYGRTVMYRFKAEL